MELYLANESDTLAFGKRIAKLCPDQHFTLHLQGDLGAGKTTFTRGLLTGLGHVGKVKSPTYTLVEQYQVDHRTIFHFDLYRLTDPEELMFLGLDDYLTGNALCLIEWPQRGQGYLPEPDITLTFNYQQEGRTVSITATSHLGEKLLLSLSS
jgi:tRNA threonylcarbamoyladenosine biosynthesis protein TsaE